MHKLNSCFAVYLFEKARARELLHSAGRLTQGEISLTPVTTGRVDGKSQKERDVEEEAQFGLFPHSHVANINV